MPSFFARAINRLTWLAEVLAEVGLAVLLLIVFHEVIVRYVFNSPTLYSVELSEYLLVWVVFMSIAWVLKEDRHVAVTFVIDMMPQKVRQGLRLATSLLTMVFLGVLIWQGGRTARTAFLGDYHSSSLLNFPMWIPYILIPLGALFLGLQYIVNILEIIQSLISKDPGIEKPVR